MTKTKAAEYSWLKALLGHKEAQKRTGYVPGMAQEPTKTNSSGNTLSWEDVYGLDYAYSDEPTVLVASNEKMAAKWRKEFPGYKVVLAASLPQPRTRKRKGTDAIPTQSKDSEEK